MPKSTLDYPTTLDQEFLDRMFEKCEKDDCCLISNFIHPSPHGYTLKRLTGNKKDPKYFLHRVVLSMTTGQDPKDKFALHKCSKFRGDKIDKRQCIKPEHLSWGTQAENAQDMVRIKTHHLMKLDYDIADQIRKEYAEGGRCGRKSKKDGKGVMHKDLAEKYGVNKSQITRIINNQIYVRAK
jgi:hypothetical protein